MKASLLHSTTLARDVRAVTLDAAQIDSGTLAGLAKHGIVFDADEMAEMAEAYGMAMDAAPDLTPTQYAANIGVPVQFLQTILPGFVNTVTIPRSIDRLVGISTVGSWEDDEIIQGALEPVGLAQPYTDLANIPLASYNNVWERRNVTRFEAGARVGKLEARRAAKGRIDAMSAKRGGAQSALDFQRNRVGFYGYNAGANRTYGFLNDPSLPAYATVTGGVWSAATFLVITAQLRVAFAGLRTQSGTNIDPTRDAITIAVASNKVDFLSVTSDYGNSVWDWLKENYPNARVEAIPELNAANGGADVMYIYAETVPADGSTDGNQTFMQLVPNRFFMVGTEINAKSAVEDFSNATAGVLLKRPWAVKRYSGI